ncbi:MAG: GC-type dockerin domain-anchored protein [Phycisphaerales bacterium JB065]
MLATTAAVMTALGAPISVDPPDLRYELSRQPELGPIERDLRYYPPTPPERQGLRSFEHLIAPLVEQALVTEQALDPAAGKSTLRWQIGADVWSVRATALVWTDSGYRWVEVEGRRISELITGESTFEIDLRSVPGHLYTSVFAVTIDQAALSSERNLTAPGPISTSVLISESRLPGDFDRDGSLTLSDLDTYSAAFAAEAPRADLNRDGQVDTDDLRIYLAAFDANFRP